MPNSIDYYKTQDLTAETVTHDLDTITGDDFNKWEGLVAKAPKMENKKTTEVSSTPPSVSSLNASLEDSRNLIQTPEIDCKQVEGSFDIDTLLYYNNPKVENIKDIQDKIRELEDKLTEYKRLKNKEESSLKIQKEVIEDESIIQFSIGNRKQEAEFAKQIELIDAKLLIISVDRDMEENKMRREIKLLEAKLKSINN
jgi:hypothetical protein